MKSHVFIPKTLEEYFDGLIKVKKSDDYSLHGCEIEEAAGYRIAETNELDFLCDNDSLINNIAKYLNYNSEENSEKVLESIKECARKYYEEILDEKFANYKANYEPDDPRDEYCADEEQWRKSA